jgi:hypothetical protein
LKSIPKNACGTNINTTLNFPLIKLLSDNKQCQVYLNEIFLIKIIKLNELKDIPESPGISFS